MELPHEWKELDGETKRLLEANLSHCDLVQYDTGLVMPRVFAETMADKVYSFEVREDDIWVVSFPKTGTTLMLEMLWMIINNMVRCSGVSTQSNVNLMVEHVRRILPTLPTWSAAPGWRPPPS